MASDNGSILLTPELKRTLYLAKRKYEIDFVSFYTTLLEKGYYLPDTPEHKKIQKALEEVQDLAQAIERLISPLWDHTQKELDYVLKKMKSADRGLKTLSDQLKKDTAHSEAVRAELDKNGIDADNLLKSNRILAGRSKKLAERPSLGKRISGVWDETPNLAQDIAKGALSSALGPVGGIAEAAFGAGKWMLDRHRNRKSALEQEKILAAGMTGKDTPGTFARTFGRLGSSSLPRSEEGPRESSNKSPWSGLGNFASSFTGMGSRKDLGSSLGLSDNKLGMTVSEAVASGLKIFFTAGWKAAKWTKDLYDKLMGNIKPKRGEEEQKSSNPFAGLFSLLGGIGNIFRGVGALFKVVGGLLGAAVRGLMGVITGLGSLAKGLWNLLTGLGGILKNIGTRAAQGAGKALASTGKFLTTPLGGTLLGTAAIGSAAVMAGMLNNAWTQEAINYDKLADANDAWAFQEFLKVNNMNRAKKGLPPVGLHTPAKPSTASSMSKGSSTSSPQSFVSGNVGMTTSLDKNIPIDTTDTQNDLKMTDQLAKINQSLTDIKESSIASSASTNMHSGYDAYNLRDPLLAALNSGNLDLE